ncbi:hypothetical protein O181_069073 [Austropuccinia psidii MF-1]|uniref:HMG box domain-containing protein n=1 Tax=Austropuccinia psidii MF-1 TaxID=1389203 RepID=A0A9Q3I610_9BASI|nr:hypothetical protein [Austropuccinia psidii MF-1]
MYSSGESVAGFLTSIGLSDYLEIFVFEGFDTIQSIEEITENDLEHMHVKRGHRRILQRALGQRLNSKRLVEPSSPIPSPNTNHSMALASSSCIQSSKPTTNPLLSQSPTICVAPLRQKRRYRRHPKPDPNAPEKPLSAYVMFSNTIREQLKGQQISFTEIARLVGDRWKNLDQTTKESFERRATEEKAHWSRLMTAYKTTHEHEQYRRYLVQFKEAQSRRSAISERNATCALSNGSENTSNEAFGPTRADDTSYEDEESEADCDDWDVKPNSGYPSRSAPSPHDRSPSPPCHLPPPVAPTSQQRPKIPGLVSLDQHLSKDQPSFFRSKLALS